jgi:hypothetical protein
MIQEKTEATTRSQDPRHFRDGRIDLANVLENQTGDDHVELFVSERKTLGTGPRDVHPTASLGGHPNLIPRGVDTHHQLGTDSLGQAGHLALSAADVENATTAGHLFRRQRENLFLVLGVDTVGEAIDPP